MSTSDDMATGPAADAGGDGTAETGADAEADVALGADAATASPGGEPPGGPPGTEHSVERLFSRRRGADSSAIDDLERQLGEAKAAEASTREQHLRLAADFDNFRRRKAQELTDRSRYASEEAALALLPVLDNLRRALESAPADEPEGLVNGVRITVRDFEAALERLGVTTVEADGLPFDPSLHEAVLGEESDEVERDTVVQVLQQGYRLHDRLLRPAMVKVAHPAAAAAPAAD
ncbi:MAG: nucleotide exchange factor GrpE [Candidatus Dormibacteria bacterium]